MAFLEFIDQGIGNAGASPWAVSGNLTTSGGVAQGTFPWIVSGGVTQGNTPWIISGGVTLGQGVVDVLNAALRATIINTVTISGGVAIGAPLPPGTNTIGGVTQGTTPWTVSGGVSIGSPLPPGSNTLGAINQGTSGSSAWLITVGQGVTDVANQALRTALINIPSVNQGTSPWVVAGPTASGTLFVNPPVMVGGADLGGIIRTLLTDSSGRQVMTGAAVAGSGSAGSPIPMGGQDGSGNQQFIRLSNGASPLGSVGVPASVMVVWDTVTVNNRPVESANSAFDGMGGSNHTAVGVLHFNETNYDRVRNNTQTALLSSAIRTTTQTSADLISYNLGGLHVILDITAGSGSLNVVINGKDPASLKYYTILSGATVTTVPSTNVYRVFPGATPVPNAIANDHIPRTYQIVVQHGNGNLIQYTLGSAALVI